MSVFDIPELLDIQAAEGSPVKVLMISLDEKKIVNENLQAFLQGNGINFGTFFLGGDQEDFIRFWHPGWDGTVPLNLLMNKKGEVLEVIPSPVERLEVEMLVNKHQQSNQPEQ